MTVFQDMAAANIIPNAVTYGQFCLALSHPEGTSSHHSRHRRRILHDWARLRGVVRATAACASPPTPTAGSDSFVSSPHTQLSFADAVGSVASDGESVVAVAVIPHAAKQEGGDSIPLQSCASPAGVGADSEDGGTEVAACGGTLVRKSSESSASDAGPTDHELLGVSISESFRAFTSPGGSALSPPRTTTAAEAAATAAAEANASAGTAVGAGQASKADADDSSIGAEQVEPCKDADVERMFPELAEFVDTDNDTSTSAGTSRVGLVTPRGSDATAFGSCVMAKVTARRLKTFARGLRRAGEDGFAGTSVARDPVLTLGPAAAHDSVVSLPSVPSTRSMSFVASPQDVAVFSSLSRRRSSRSLCPHGKLARVVAMWVGQLSCSTCMTDGAGAHWPMDEEVRMACVASGMCSP